MDEPLSEKPSDELERMMAETEACLAELRHEVQRRRQTAQSIEIDNLETHLKEARVKWGELKRFFEIVLQELRR